MFKKNKKAEAESQFNWIFVLVAGGVILLFFAIFIYRYRDLNDKKLEIKFNQDLDLMISMSGITSNSLNNRSDVPFKDFEFSCQGLGVTDFRKKVVFAPSIVKTRRLYLYSHPFLTPFMVSNFVYVISPNIKYVFVLNENDDASSVFFHDLNDVIPKGAMLRDKTPIYMYKDIFVQSQSVRFIFINQNVNRLLIDKINKDVKDNKYKSLSVLSVSTHDQKISFYEQDKETKKLGFTGDSYYFDEASLLGAVVSDDKDLYDCMVANAFNKLYYMSSVYLGKISKLREGVGLVCPITIYDELESGIYLLRSLSSELKHEDDFSEIGTSISKVGDFKDHVAIIDAENKKIEKSACATLY